MKLPQKLSEKTAALWKKTSPELIFVSVLCCFPGFLFQRNVTILVAEAVLFFLLALTRRGKVRLLPSVLMIFFVTFFSLLVPYGKVLWRIGGDLGFAITAGALENGLRRGIILAGMVFLSQLAISPQLTLPGKVGKFTVLVFGYLDCFSKVKLEVNPQKIICSLDQRLVETWQQELSLDETITNTATMQQKNFFCYVFVILLPFLLYALLLWQHSL